MNFPVHRFELTISIGANTWPELIAELKSLRNTLQQHGPKSNSFRAGYGANHSLYITVDESITEETYAKRVEEYRAELGLQNKSPAN